MSWTDYRCVKCMRRYMMPPLLPDREGKIYVCRGVEPLRTKCDGHCRKVCGRHLSGLSYKGVFVDDVVGEKRSATREEIQKVVDRFRLKEKQWHG